MSAPAACAPLVGDSAVARSLRAQVTLTAGEDGPVLLEGERGSGREHLARWLHAHSRRRTAVFIRIDAEFAGSERAADKLRRAHGGTVLIKDVAFAPARLRNLLAQQLHHAPDADPAATVRMIATSDVPLERLLREHGSEPPVDLPLLAALSLRTIRVPPLRERMDDLPLLTSHFLRALPVSPGGPARLLTPRALDALARYSWPGNLAELRDVVRRAALRTGERRVDLGDIEAVLPPTSERVPLEELSLEDVVRVKLRALLQRLEGYPITDLYEQVLGYLERPLLDEALRRTGGNQIQAARMLGINRNTLRSKLKERGLSSAPPPASPPPARSPRG